MPELLLGKNLWHIYTEKSWDIEEFTNHLVDILDEFSGILTHDQKLKIIEALEKKE